MSDDRAGVDMAGQPDPDVAPAAGIMLEQALLLPGKVEAGCGWVCLWQA